uniref:Putative small GTP-binding protein domain n=1 Tax=Moniliophthora roreri TaxID=221103 RepID=A0A0W0FT23_MONRR
MNSNVSGAPDLQQKYRHFRILVIGRANAGKTTLLKRVCNTTEEPCIYDEERRNLLEPTADRGVHNIYQPFAFASNPQFIFHDSPGFEKGGEKELKDVQGFIEKCAQATNVEDQLHAIWFCLVTDASRPLLELETRFFQEKCFGNVPVIAVFTKFDDLITQLYDDEKEECELRKEAESCVERKFQEPLAKCKYPPKEYLCLEDMQEDKGNHQEQVKELMQKTADSLDNPTLQLLFVSIQQNNLELCIKYAVK